MNKTILLSAAALVAVLSCEAPVAAAARSPGQAPYTVLWSQNSNFNGAEVNSQNYTSGTFSANNDAGADDFVVPSGQTWRVAEVDVTGGYFNGAGPATSEVVTFFKNKRGKPGRIRRGPFTLNCTDNGGSFQCILPSPVKLRSGTWWVSVVANCSFLAGCGQWDWLEIGTVYNNEATWEQPAGVKCWRHWEQLNHCGGGTAADFAFDLIGTQ